MVKIIIPNGVIREPTQEDVAEVARISSDRSVLKNYFVNEAASVLYMLEHYWGARFKVQEEDRRLDGKCVRQAYHLVIEEKGKTKGILNLFVAPYVINKDGLSFPKHSAELGYFIGKEYQNQGLGTRVLEAVVPYVFNELDNIGHLVGTCLVGNTASKSLLERAGLIKRWEGISDEMRTRGKKTVTYSLFDDEFYRNNSRLELAKAG